MSIIDDAYNEAQKKLMANSLSGQEKDTVPPEPSTTLPPEIAEQFKAFSNGNIEFVPMLGAPTTETNLSRYLHSSSRPNVDPQLVSPWECRIGLSRFYVPPTSISVHQQFRTGSMGGAIRQSTTPKFNAGHSDTVIVMKVYFPNDSEIWGFDGNQISINFDSDDESVIDRFASSLRGLVTQFKYAPFLPVRNTYLNGTFNITGVALQSLTVSAVPDMPFCVEAELTMLKLNHKAYLPMISDFNDAIHWGRFRQYIGRGAFKLAQAASKDFLLKEQTESEVEPYDPSHADNGSPDVINQDPQFINGRYTFNKMYEWQVGKFFEIYYPEEDPAKIAQPSLSNFDSEVDPASSHPPQRQRSWWESMLSFLGVDLALTPEAGYDIVSRNALALGEEGIDIDPMLGNESRLLLSWLRTNEYVAGSSGPSPLELGSSVANEYLTYRLNQLPHGSSDEMSEEAKKRIKEAWFATVYQKFVNDPYLQNVFAYQERKRGSAFIREWEVPMTKLGLDPKRLFVQDVRVMMTNTIARLQVSLQDSPVHQHISTGDTMAQLSMLVFGEEELVKLRTVFETINGYARVERASTVLGFMGIKNVLTAICGMKYCMPQSFDVSTIEGYPHVYSVKISLIDFDVFQQKREMLSSEQQEDLVKAFGKRNPFLRIFQYWGMFSAYPDFPLAVRDDDGRIIGHLDPDYYFKSFETIEDDIVNWRSADRDTGSSDRGMTVDFGGLSEDGTSQSLNIDGNGMQFFSGKEQQGEGTFDFDEAHGGNVNVNPLIEGMTPSSGYVQPYVTDEGKTYGGGLQGNFNRQWDEMFKDTQYRNKTGRMIRAFPTYMLWLIDEGGNFAGVKLFDNFYGLQSVLDINLVSSEDILGDTLVIKLSNMYKRLSTPYRDLVDPDVYKYAKIINDQINRARNLASGLTDYLVKLDTIDLKPGVRVHLRLGYSANPNALETVFNGMITQVEQGDVVTITCQSDAIELGSIVNNRDKEGSSGKLDGSLMSGLWMSEPRDLMVRLLTMGSSTTREIISHATNGMIYSENKFGIKHFGTILYQPLTFGEVGKHKTLQQTMSKITGNMGKTVASAASSQNGSSIFGAMNSGIYDLMNGLWGNFSAQRDFELFKRNIYPGNGTGIAQYLGGDLGDGGDRTGFNATGVDTTGNLINPLTGESIPIGEVAVEQILNPDGTVTEGKKNIPSQKENGHTGVGGAWDAFNPFSFVKQSTGSGHEFLKHIGLASKGDDDLRGFDEVSFRAQTYMRSVWDLFVMCAGLLPNYIVAVRPFMDRSTVFYGKPHWLYTSGVVPLTTGIDPGKEPAMVPPDAEIKAITDKMEAQYRQRETPEDFYTRLTEIGIDANTTSGGDPYDTTTGTVINPYTGLISKVSPPSDTGKLTMRWFIQIMLSRLGAPQTLKNVAFFTAWSGWESGWGTDGGEHPKFNPWATTQSMPGDTLFNSRVRNYPDLATGIEAIVKTLQNGHYPTILASVMSGDPFSSISASSEWLTYTGEGNYAQKINDSAQRFLQNPALMEYGHSCFNNAGYKGTASGVVFDGETGSVKSAVNNIQNDAIDGSTNVAGSPDLVNEEAYGVGAVSGSLSDDVKSLGFNIDKFRKGHYKKALPGWMVNDQKELELPDPDPQRYSLKFGWFNSRVPVNYTDPSSGLTDVVGAAASQVFMQSSGKKDVLFADTGRTGSEANEIWDEFRRFFPRDDTRWGKKALDLFAEVHPEVIGVEVSYNKVTKLTTTSKADEVGNAVIYEELVREMAVLSYLSSFDRANPENQKFIKEYEETLDRIKANPGLKYYQVMANFMQFMWQHPYHRGWVVKTADVRADMLDQVSGWADDQGKFLETIPYIGEWVAKPFEAIGGIVSEGVDFIRNAKDSVFGFLGGNNAPDNDRHWDFPRILSCWEQYISSGNDAAVQFMIDNASPGRDMKSAGFRAVEEFKRTIFDPIYSFLKNIVKGIGAVVTGLISLIRMSMQMFTYGLGMVSANQQQANVLNKFLNDSIYYDTDYGVGSLLYLADNPFTREYGEPVVEIRQPFQRMHYLSASEHIIHNGIIENTDGIFTQVTATANGNHPVTVYFDRGASPERQVEKVVETGLWWDKPTGWTKIFHPVSLFRGWAKNAQGASDEISSKRIALYHLKESLKDIYDGEIIVLGQPDIRPFDLVYLSDSYEKIYGMFEVEQVVHQFTPHYGFITSITPNAIVTINDPAKWMLNTHLHQIWSSWNLRNDFRSAMGVKYRSRWRNLPDSVDLNSMSRAFEDQVKGSVGYTGGSMALVRELSDSIGLGMLKTLTPTNISGFGGVIGNFVPNFWSFEHVRQNLYDQHGCYIQYLNKSGNPMDANLTSNHGVAVGHQKIATLFQNSLRIPIPISQDGSSIIRTNELLKNMGWNQSQVDSLVRDVDYWTNKTLKELLDLTNRDPSGAPFVTPEVYVANVVDVVDGQTFLIDQAFAPNGVRLGGVVAPGVGIGPSANITDIGSLSVEFLRQRLIDDQVNRGFAPTVALRVNPTNRQDRFGRLIAWVFHNEPQSFDDIQKIISQDKDNRYTSAITDDDKRSALLYLMANSVPQLSWDAYHDDGRPYTYNWEAIVAGLLNIDRASLNLAVPNSGVEGIAR